MGRKDLRGEKVKMKELWYMEKEEICRINEKKRRYGFKEKMKEKLSMEGEN